MLTLVALVAGFTFSLLAQQNAPAVKDGTEPPMAPQVKARLDELESTWKAARAKDDVKGEAGALNAIGKLYFAFSFFPQALDAYHQAMERAHAAQDAIAESDALTGAGLCDASTGQNDKAHDEFQQALDLANSSGDPRVRAAALSGLGWLALILRQYSQALQDQNQALPLAQQTQDLELQGQILRGTGLAQYMLGDKQAAIASLDKSLAMHREAGDREGEAKALNALGSLQYDLGMKSQALDTENQAAALYLDSGDYIRATDTLAAMATAYLGDREIPKALDAYNRLLEIDRQTGNRAHAALVLRTLGEIYSDTSQPQKALDSDNQALAIYRETQDHAGEASALFDIGYVHYTLGEPQKALDSFDQALPLFRAQKDSAEEARTLLNIGAAYSALSELQKALEYYNQALPLVQQGGDHAAEAKTLSNMGGIYGSMGDAQKALASYNRALALDQQAGNKAGEAASLNLIGTHHSMQGEQRKALEFYDRALSIYRQLGSREGEASTLGCMGWAYSALGDEQKAMDDYTQALAIFHETGVHGGEALMQGLTGALYGKLGQNEKALDALKQALSFFHQAGMRDGEEWVLYAIGRIYYVMDDRKSALNYYQGALQNFKDVNDRLGQASALMSLGKVYTDLGNDQAALDDLNQGLSIRRQMGDRDGEAETLDYLAEAYSALGQRQKALDALNQALPLATEVNDPDREAQVLHTLLKVEAGPAPALAIYYGKQAVNLLQQVRTNIQEMDKALQQSFLSKKDDYYHDLATLLIEQGRLPEAQQVLNLLKDQEYKDYVRGEAASTLNPLTLTPAEQKAAEDYQKSTAQIVAVGEQWAVLKKVANRTPEQEQEYLQLSAQLDASNKSLNDYYGRLFKLFSTSADANQKVNDVEGGVSQLKQAIARMPHTVALYTLISSSRYSVIVITGSTTVAREVPIAEKDLNQKVAALEQALRDPHSDPRPASNALYKILMGPVQADLDAAQAQTLVWSLDGVLRYVPMAALYDGKQYAVEHYAMVSITPASIPHLNEKPDFSNVSAIAMGISKQYESNLPPLPAVTGELDDVISDAQDKSAQGVLPGTILLNGAFTEKALEQALGNPHTVIHIASHFVFRPGDDSLSYLLLAGKDRDAQGYHLTVADFRDNQEISLLDTDLLTLSACETGMSGSASNGREVDGLGTTAQLKGARAVISSLWEVDDASTGALMADFYKRWAGGAGKVTKVEALREAQMDLLDNQIAQRSDSSGRGLSAESQPDAQPAQLGYAHPYYWAPFVLMGNWR